MSSSQRRKARKDQKKRDPFKIRNHHAWLSLILYILSVVTIGSLLYASTAMIVDYIVTEKVQTQIEDLMVIRNSVEQGDDTTVEYTDAEYILESSDGTVLASRGEDTRVTGDHEALDRSASLLSMSSVSIAFADEDVEITDDDQGDLYFIKDTECSYLRIEEGSVELRLFSFLKSDYLSDILKSDEDRISLPFWLAQADDDGNIFYYKAHMDIMAHDILIMLGYLIIIVVILIIMFVVLLIMVIRNIRDRSKMKKLIFLDEISDNHNWVWFMIRARQLLKKKKNAGYRYAVINLVFTDFRHFALCHSLEEGKEVLRKIYSTLAENCGKNELCAHSTASNFPLLLTCTDKEDLTKRLTDLFTVLAKVEDDHKFTFHAGAAFIDVVTDRSGKPAKRADTDIEMIYNNASAARMSLDGNGDSAVAFFDEEFAEQQRWLDTVNECAEGAVRDHEFVIYYQPKYDPRSNELRGAEALIRWSSPKFGFVPPYKFIPIFEQNGFITRIDHYMISGVARAQKAWLDKGYKCVPVSVNVSRAHFIEEDLAEQIRDLVDSEGCPHELIEIELTESAFFDDQKTLLDTIARIKEYGFSVSMDDFGSGYSSLNSLKDIPLDVLKLDAGFFRSTADDGRDRIVVSEAIGLAKKLNMKIVAEGVEEQEQVDFLAGEGCDMIQGYFYAKPMPEEEYESRMEPPEVPGA